LSETRAEGGWAMKTMAMKALRGRRSDGDL
jgi:hypothetical protein